VSDPVYSVFSDLLALLSEAVKKVPSVRYALGVAGIGAAAAIVYGAFQWDSKTAVFGTAIMIGFMVVLLVFASLTGTKSNNIRYAGFVLMWVMVVCFCTIPVGLLSSFFFGWPPLKFDLRESPECIAQANRMPAVSQSIDNFISEQCVLANRISIFVARGAPGDWQRVTEKARTYGASVTRLQNRMSNEPDLYAALSGPSFRHFNELLDQKEGVAADAILRESAPPSDRRPLEKIAEKLRNYATQASEETRSLQNWRPDYCQRRATPPAATVTCTKPSLD
jgi:hypothetical protein